jgi:hypothetical protein
VRSAARKYLVSRATASTLALMLSILYSVELGPQNRGYVTVIMTFSILTIVGSMGGTTLTARKIGSLNFTNELRASYRTLIAIEILIGLAIFVVLVIAYSEFKQMIPGPLVLASILYFLSSAYHFAAIEWKMAQKRLALAGAAEIVTILVQILSFFVLLKIGFFSAAVTVLIAFTFSYFLVGTWCNFSTGFHKDYVKLISTPKHFFVKTKGHHILGIIINILDRSDRIVISLLFPTATLAKYAAMGGILAFLRFVPDTLSKIAVTGSNFYPRILKERKWLSLFILILGVFVFVIFARMFIEFSLGDNWLLPLSTFAAFCIYELSRGIFQVYANKNVQQGLEMLSQRSVFYVLVTFLFALPFALSLFGLGGVPLSLAIAYLFGVLLLVRSTHE